MDAYGYPRDPPTGPARTPWLTWARWALGAMAAENLLVGCGLGSLGMLGWVEYVETDGKYPAAFYVAWPLTLLCAGWMPAALQVAAAWGLGRESRLAWGFSIFVAAVNLLSCNAPFAAVVLWALLGHEETRARFRVAPLVVLPLLLPLLAPSPAAAQEPAPDEHAKACDACEAWNAPHAPFRVAGNTWYVGPEGLSVLAVDTGAGVVLLDGALPQSVPGIVANLAALGLDVADVRYILVSHAHYDHVGGVAALQRRTGATVVGTVPAVAALRAGNVPDEDPQAGFGPDAMAFPPVEGPVLALADGESVVLGDQRFTLVATPGHTPGGASWRFGGPDGSVILYADSLNPISADGFRFSDDPARVDRFRASIAAVAATRCDVLVPVHPSATDLYTRAARPGGLPARKGDPCAAYAKAAARRLEQRLRDEARGG